MMEGGRKRTQGLPRSGFRVEGLVGRGRRAGYESPDHIDPAVELSDTNLLSGGRQGGKRSPDTANLSRVE